MAAVKFPGAIRSSTVLIICKPAGERVSPGLSGLCYSYFPFSTKGIFRHFRITRIYWRILHFVALRPLRLYLSQSSGHLAVSCKRKGALRGVGFRNNTPIALRHGHFVLFERT